MAPAFSILGQIKCIGHVTFPYFELNANSTQRRLSKHFYSSKTADINKKDATKSFDVSVSMVYGMRSIRCTKVEDLH